ncbi:prolipoprotein diacylglyceryl transferase [Mycobacteroides saopaulense]|uniref:Diacylglyceryl transferase n=1 Tax=Mycobacteroides saopaulense TaxID=1578165 RepID=A0ABX3C466_9MYCO|nr:prolipoprotein diacylglyceryl transferase family protein [Mycobacteroides saopaulense]OHT88530.1 diacylglyceryl transferase [Mycobacteroides saopaulense]OHU13348.1 diacylglyceryl transferase [Mycobacteroides saopaulense]
MGLGIGVHGLFVGLGVLVAAIVFACEARRRGAPAEQSLIAVAGALVGGAIGMRLSGWIEHLNPALNPSLTEAWMFGSRSIIGGLLGAYAGVLVAKRLIGYHAKTGDLFAPAVALGMAVGRIGCHLTEAPGRPTSLPWGIHAPASRPDCPGCLAGVAMHPSFLYEIAFQLAAFAVLWWWLRPRVTRPGELFVLYVSAYAVFRFLVEFTRANETVWLNLTRPQWVLLLGMTLAAWRLWRGYRAGYYEGLFRRRVPEVVAA